MIFPGPREIAHRLLFRSRDPHGGELTGAMQAGERFTVPAVGLHPVPGLYGDQRGRHHRTGMAQMGQLTKDPVAAGTGLGAERQDLPLGA